MSARAAFVGLAAVAVLGGFGVQASAGTQVVCEDGYVLIRAVSGEFLCQVLTEPEPAAAAPDDPASPAPAKPEVTCTYRRPEEVSGATGINGGGELFVRTMPDGEVQLAYWKECSNGFRDWIWVSSQPPGAPPPTPADLAPAARDLAIARLPQPIWHTPADWNEHGWTYVQLPTFVWVDDAVWIDISAEATLGGVWARAVATPTKVILDPGTGDAPVECPFKPPPYVKGVSQSEVLERQGCWYRYRHTSLYAPNGDAYEVRLSMVWHITWTGSDGSGGDLGEHTMTADPRLLQVAEIQAIITSGPGD